MVVEMRRERNGNSSRKQGGRKVALDLIQSVRREACRDVLLCYTPTSGVWHRSEVGYRVSFRKWKWGGMRSGTDSRAGAICTPGPCICGLRGALVSCGEGRDELRTQSDEE